MTVPSVFQRMRPRRPPARVVSERSVLKTVFEFWHGLCNTYGADRETVKKIFVR